MPEISGRSGRTRHAIVTRGTLPESVKTWSAHTRSGPPSRGGRATSSPSRMPASRMVIGSPVGAIEGVGRSPGRVGVISTTTAPRSMMIFAATAAPARSNTVAAAISAIRLGRESGSRTTRGWRSDETRATTPGASSGVAAHSTSSVANAPPSSSSDIERMRSLIPAPPAPSGAVPSHERAGTWPSRAGRRARRPSRPRTTRGGTGIRSLHGREARVG